jgi:hypothetical protein
MYSMRAQLCPTNVHSSFEVLCQRLKYSSILPELVWLRYLRKLRWYVEVYEALIALGTIFSLLVTRLVNTLWISKAVSEPME